MKKLLASLILASTAFTAQAADRGDVAAGIIGGLILGNMIGQHQQYPQTYPQPYPPVVVQQPPVIIQNPCYWVQEPLYDGYGRIVTYRQVRVCRNY